MTICVIISVSKSVCFNRHTYLVCFFMEKVCILKNTQTFVLDLVCKNLIQ